MNSRQLTVGGRQSAVGSWRRCLLPTAYCLLLCVSFAQSAGAQTGTPSATSLRGFGTAGLTIFTAANSFKAVFDRSTGELFGGGLEVGFSRHLFVTMSASRFARTGRRLFAFEDQVFDLHEPTIVRITPIELSLGYRYVLSPRVRPYVSGGVGWHRYEERSARAGETEDVRDTFMGYQLLGGIETPLRPWLGIAGEAQFTGVPNALGQSAGSVGSVYDEHDLGGLTLRVKVVLGR